MATQVAGCPSTSPALIRPLSLAVAVPATVGGSLGALAFAGSALAAVARRRMGSGGRRRSRQLNLPRNFNSGASAAPVSPASTPYYYNPVTTHGGWEYDGGWQRSGQSKSNESIGGPVVVVVHVDYF